METGESNKVQLLWLLSKTPAGLLQYQGRCIADELTRCLVSLQVKFKQWPEGFNNIKFGDILSSPSANGNGFAILNNTIGNLRWVIVLSFLHQRALRVAGLLDKS